MEGIENFISKQSEMFIRLLASHYEWTFLILGLFILIAAWRDWDWVFDPPYNSIKNPIGFFFGRKAYRFTWFTTGILVVFLSCGLIYYKNT